MSGRSMLRLGVAVVALLVVVAATGCTQIKDAAAALGPNPFGDREYTSTSGTDTGGSVDWLADYPVRVSATPMNGALTIIASTPCNTLDVAVAVRGDRLLPDLENSGGTAMGCSEPQSGQEAWVWDLLRAPVVVDGSGTTLTLAGSGKTLRLDAPTTDLASLGANPFEGMSFTSRTILDDHSELDFGKRPFTVAFFRQLGHLGISAMACNDRGHAVEIRGSTLVPTSGEWPLSAVGCTDEGARDTHLAWVDAFIAKRLTVTLTDSTLTLAHGRDLVRLARTDAAARP